MIKGLVSIIVPAYNVEENIPYCLDSLINQTYENIEIICVNDGSSDNTESVIKDYSEKDSRVKLITKENGGVSSARNTGLDAADGEYISFVDSDDFVSERFISRLIELITDYSADIARCRMRGNVTSYDYVEPEPENPPVIKTRTMHEALEIYYDGVFYGWYADDAAIVCNCLFKSEIFNNLRFDSSIERGEDECMIQLAISEAEKLVYTDERLYFYYVNDTSLTHAAYDERLTLRRIDRIYGNQQDCFRKKGLLDIASKNAKYACDNFCEVYISSSDKSIKADAVKGFKKFYSLMDNAPKQLRVFNFSPFLYKVLVKILYKNKKTA